MKYVDVMKIYHAFGATVLLLLFTHQISVVYHILLVYEIEKVVRNISCLIWCHVSVKWVYT